MSCGLGRERERERKRVNEGLATGEWKECRRITGCKGGGEAITSVVGVRVKISCRTKGDIL